MKQASVRALCTAKPLNSRKSINLHGAHRSSHESQITIHEPLPRGRCAAHDLDNLARNGRLADLVHVQRQRVRSRRRPLLVAEFHGRHSRGVFRGGAFGQACRENLHFDVPRHEAV